VYRRRAPLAWLASLFAVVGGILLARSEWVRGAILVGFALVAAVGHLRDEDSSGLY
jgi:membrane-associated PAP2 superfamily phosphatase